MEFIVAILEKGIRKGKEERKGQGRREREESYFSTLHPPTVGFNTLV